MGVFTELLALGQCLPGPTSTQMSFAIGVVSRGVPGGLLSGILFQYPGLLMMTLIGAGAAEWLSDPADWLRSAAHGFGAVGVALVAGAALGLCKKLCTTRILQAMCAVSAIIAYYHPTAYTFPSLIAAGGIASIIENRHKDLRPKATDAKVDRLGFGMVTGGLLIIVWLAVLITVVVTRQVTDYEDARALHWFEAFYRIGSIIFGGGQVVLPMLMDEVTFTGTAAECTGSKLLLPASLPEPCGWVTKEQFLAGLGLVQAMPGPLFNLSAYLGAVIAIRAGIPWITGVVSCWVGLFGPGLILIYGVLPFWGRFRDSQVYRRALPGLNAAAVGLVVAACFQLFIKIHNVNAETYEALDWPKGSVCIMIAAFTAVEYLGLPAPAAVGLGGIAGIIAHYTGMN